ncbi:MAG: MltA domain-containing protein, partial [Planctomycetota bacterium]
SLWPDDVYRYALYALPSDLEKAIDGTILGQRTEAGLAPYPSRRIIEANRLLDGLELELVYLRDPLDAFIAHVNGSAVVRLNDGTDVRLGYAGKNGREYTSLGAELVKDGFISADELSLSSIRAWARAHPALVSAYLDRNASYVFFTPIDGPPRGSLNVPVSAQRTLATDKAIFPRGAIVYVDTTLPMQGGGRAVFRQLMFDQDTGGAIRTAGRADIYLGMGPEAEYRAGSTRSTGQLFYFFLKQ